MTEGKEKTQTLPLATPARPRRVPAHRKTEKVEQSRIVKTVNEDQPVTKEQLEQIKISVEFKLIAGEAKSVAVAGNFNGWNAKKAPMKKVGDWWIATLELPRGRYEYRFVVDGKWLSDPNAKESAANAFGSENSVLSV